MRITNIFYTFIICFAYIYIDSNIYGYADSFNSKNKNIETLKCPPNNEIKLYNNYFYSENIEEKELYKKELLYNKLNYFGCALKDYEKYLQKIEKKEIILNEDLLIITQKIDLLFHKYKQKILKININNNLKNNNNNNNNTYIYSCWIMFQIFCFICGVQKILEFIFMPPFNNKK